MQRGCFPTERISDSWRAVEGESDGTLTRQTRAMTGGPFACLPRYAIGGPPVVTRNCSYPIPQLNRVLALVQTGKVMAGGSRCPLLGELPSGFE